MEELIPIKIKGAKVVSVNINFINLKFTATVSLIAEHNQSLTSIYVGNTGWKEEDNAEATLTFHELCGELKRELDTIVVRHINKQQKLLAPS